MAMYGLAVVLYDMSKHEGRVLCFELVSFNLTSEFSGIYISNYEALNRKASRKQLLILNVLLRSCLI